MVQGGGGGEAAAWPLGKALQLSPHPDSFPLISLIYHLKKKALRAATQTLLSVSIFHLDANIQACMFLSLAVRQKCAALKLHMSRKRADYTIATHWLFDIDKYQV